MPSSKRVVLDVENLCHRKEKFFVEKFGICKEDYFALISFLPPTSFSEFTTQQRQFFSWLSRNFHGIGWYRINYLYIYLIQNIRSVCLRNPGVIFYAKKAEKINFFSVVLKLWYWSEFTLVFFDICELVYTKLSKSFKSQKQFQQTICKRKGHFLVQLVSQWEKNWQKWRHPCHWVHQIVPWLRGAGIWVFQFPKAKP